MEYSSDDYMKIMAHIDQKWPKGCYQCGNMAVDVKLDVSFLSGTGANDARDTAVINVYCPECGFINLLDPTVVADLDMGKYVVVG